MTDDRSLERAARSWLETGPTTAPDRAVDAALLRIQTTSQERDLGIPWRKPVTLTSARLAAFVAASVLVVAGAVALLGVVGQAKTGPTEPPSTMPTTRSAVPRTAAPAIGDPGLGASFTSPGFGYSIKFPTGWTPTGGAGVPPGYWATDGSADAISNRATTVRVWSVRLVSAQSDPQWLEAYCEHEIGDAASCPAAIAGWPAVAIGGHSGYLSKDESGSVGSKIEAVTIVGGRGYVASIVGAADRTFFQAFLDTMQFDPESAVDLPLLNDSFTSSNYRFSIGAAKDWGVKVATTTWVGFDDAWPNVDRLEVTGTDSVIDMGSQPLADGQSFDQWLEAFHADATANTPPGCDGGPISTWKTAQVGLALGRYTVGCNWTTAVVSNGGRAYAFTQRDTTADPTQHLRASDFMLLLESVTFDTVPLPQRDLPGTRGGPPGTYGWQGGPGDHAGMHWVVGEGAPDSREVAAMAFSVGPGCDPQVPTQGGTQVTVAGLDGVVVEPLTPPVTFGSSVDPTTRAYALAVGKRTLCVYVTWNARTTDAERATVLKILDTIQAQPLGATFLRITFMLHDTWDTG